MKAFKCDGIIYCPKCYLDILYETEYKELVKLNTKIINVNNEFKCEACKELCSNLTSLTSLKHIVKIWENND